MCIQDNPRYIKLVEMGMPYHDIYCSLRCRDHPIFSHYPKLRNRWEVGIIKSSGREVAISLGVTPEEAIDGFFKAAEKHYGFIYQ